MAIYSDGGYLFGAGSNEQMLRHGSTINYTSGAMAGWPYYICVMTPVLTASSSGSSSVDILDVYHSGHWSNSVWGEIDINTRYYGSGVQRYSWRCTRSATSDLTLEYEQGTELASNTTGLTKSITTTGSGTHGGQSVYRTRFTMTADSYMHLQAIIRIGLNYENHTRLFDSASSIANVESYLNSNGAGIHFLNTTINGHPDRDTA